MEKIEKFSLKAEGYINHVASPIKPYLSHVGRFLLVATFIEDAIRICLQYREQVDFLRNYRSFPGIFAHVFLLYCVGAMASGSVLALGRAKMYWASGLLCSVVVLQSVGYGILFNFSFMLRNLSLVGGILLLLAESMEHERKSNGLTENMAMLRGLPNLSMSESEKSTYVSLIGRVLLILLFGSLMYNSGGHGFAESSGFGPLSTLLRGLYVVLGSVACLMVAVGFKAKYSAMLLVAILCVVNIFINKWWAHGHGSAERDFLRYDFFQTLSVIGGFMLLLNRGPGDLSFDKRRKEF